MDHLPTVVGLGEILWDFLPSGRQLGGAPANFAYCAHLLGDRAVVASRIGSDDLGQEARRSLLHKGVTDQFLQIDPAHPTGTVQVHLDAKGQPKFEITQSVAWDFLELTDTWKALAQSADAVCFGTLAQRSEQSRPAILKFLDATPTNALRVFDVNLRQQFYSAEIIEESLRRANLVKMNHEEVLPMKKLLGMSHSSPEADAASFCQELADKFDLGLVCITHGAGGSLLCDGKNSHRHLGFRVQVKDAVGAGDAFTAGLVHGHLNNSSLAEMNDLANRLGAWVASCSGAMPSPPEAGLEQALEKSG